MKSPREILLERHRSAVPALDEIRRSVMTPTLPQRIAACGAANPKPRTNLLATLWQELFVCVRPVWAGLAAIWVVIIWLNLPEAEAPPRQTAAFPPLASPDSLIALREQRQFFSQLLELSPVSVNERAWHSGPRGAIDAPWATA